VFGEAVYLDEVLRSIFEDTVRDSRGFSNIASIS